MSEKDTDLYRLVVSLDLSIRPSALGDFLQALTRWVQYAHESVYEFHEIGISDGPLTDPDDSPPMDRDRLISLLQRMGAEPPEETDS